MLALFSGFYLLASIPIILTIIFCFADITCIRLELYPKNKYVYVKEYIFLYRKAFII